MKKFFLMSVTGLFLMTGCSYRIVDFTIISTKNVDLSKASTFTRGKQRNEGKDVAHMVLYFPIGQPSMKEAIDRALEKTPGAIALLDGVVYSKSWWAILYGQNILLVEGTPLIDPSLASNSVEIPDYSIVRMDKNGKVKEYKEISEEEYLAIKSNVSKGFNKQQFNNSNEVE